MSNTEESQYKDDGIALMQFLNIPEGSIFAGDYLPSYFEHWDNPQAGRITIDICNAILAMDISPDTRALTYTMRGRGYLRLREYKSAEADFAQALAIGGKFNIPTLVAGSYEGFGKRIVFENPKMAIQALSESLNLSPNNIFVYYPRAMAYLNIGAYDQVISDATRYIEVGLPNKETAQVYLLRGGGYRYREPGNYQQAISDFSQSIELNPTPDAYRMRGETYTLVSEYQQAIEDFGRYIELKPEDPQGYLLRGMSCGTYVQQNEDSPDICRTYLPVASQDLAKFKKLAPEDALSPEMYQQYTRMVNWVRFKKIELDMLSV